MLHLLPTFFYTCQRNCPFYITCDNFLHQNLEVSEIVCIFAVETYKKAYMSRKGIVNQISQAIRRVDPTATAILYGSEARGDARPDSDIDVLILLEGDQMNLKREMDVTGPLNEIEWQTGVLVSPTVMLRKQWENMPFKTPFYINVMNEGIKI